MSLIIRYWLPISFALLTTITLLSLTPLPQLPEVPGSDKTHHLIAYGALMFPVALRQPKHWWLIGLAFLMWGGAIELIQPMVNRYGEWLDFIANAAGLFIGVTAASVARKLSNTAA